MNFQTREARDESAAVAANKVAVCVIVGHGEGLDGDVGVVPVRRFLCFAPVGFAFAVVVVKANGSFLFGQAMAVPTEGAIERVESVSASCEDVIIAGLRAVIAVAFFESQSLFREKVSQRLAGEGGYFVEGFSHDVGLAIGVSRPASNSLEDLERIGLRFGSADNVSGLAEDDCVVICAEFDDIGLRLRLRPAVVVHNQSILKGDAVQAESDDRVEKFSAALRTGGYDRGGGLFSSGHGLGYSWDAGLYR